MRHRASKHGERSEHAPPDLEQRLFYKARPCALGREVSIHVTAPRTARGCLARLSGWLPDNSLILSGGDNVKKDDRDTHKRKRLEYCAHSLRTRHLAQPEKDRQQTSDTRPFFFFFSAPDRLSSLSKRVSQMGRRNVTCTTNHRDHLCLVLRTSFILIPLSCGHTNVGQTGRCLNKRLLEHKYNVTVRISRHLGIHCRDCECPPQFSSTSMLSRSGDKMTR